MGRVWLVSMRTEESQLSTAYPYPEAYPYAMSRDDVAAGQGTSGRPVQLRVQLRV